MKVLTLASITTPAGEVPAGQVVVIPDEVYDHLREKVKPLADGYDLPHYCGPGNGWCSEKLPDSNYPAGCISIRCQYFTPIDRHYNPTKGGGI